MKDSGETQRIRVFLERQFPQAKKVGDRSSLLEGGVLDSLGILEVVSFLEQEFGLTIVDEELLPENFQSIEALSLFVRNKKKNGVNG